MENSIFQMVDYIIKRFVADIITFSRLDIIVQKGDERKYKNIFKDYWDNPVFCSSCTQTPPYYFYKMFFFFLFLASAVGFNPAGFYSYPFINPTGQI